MRHPARRDPDRPRPTGGLRLREKAGGASPQPSPPLLPASGKTRSAKPRGCRRGARSGDTKPPPRCGTRPCPAPGCAPSSGPLRLLLPLPAAENGSQKVHKGETEQTSAPRNHPAGPGPRNPRGARAAPAAPMGHPDPPGSAPLPERGAWERAAALSREPWEGFFGGRRDFFPCSAGGAEGCPPASRCRGPGGRLEASRRAPSAVAVHGRLARAARSALADSGPDTWVLRQRKIQVCVCGVHGGEGGEGAGSHQRAGAQGPFFGNIPHFVPPLNF